MAVHYRPKPLPALDTKAEREVSDELREISRWTADANKRFIDKPETCVENSLIYVQSCDPAIAGALDAVFIPVTDPSTTYAGDVVEWNVMQVFSYGNIITFADSTPQIVGAIGIPDITWDGPEALLLIAGTSLDDWENKSTRRNLGLGGSNVLIDAGTSLQFEMPGIEPYENGYTLQLAADGKTVVAGQNPPPDDEWHATSPAEGELSASAWTPVFGLSVTLDLGTEPGLAVVAINVGVEELSGNFSGTVTLGWGSLGNQPEADRQLAFPIGPGYKGRLAFNYNLVLADTLVADIPLQVWYKIDKDNPNFIAFADTSEGDHTFDVTITRGGGSGGYVPNTGSGGYWFDSATALSVNLPANDVWWTVDITSFQSNFPGNSGVILNTDGSITVNTGTDPSRCHLHAMVDMYNLTALDTDTVRMRITRNGTQIGPRTSAPWIITNNIVDDWLLFTLDLTDGGVVAGSDYYLQLACNRASTTNIRMRAVYFWLEYS